MKDFLVANATATYVFWLMSLGKLIAGTGTMTTFLLTSLAFSFCLFAAYTAVRR